jgi:hypothetical protein
MPEWYDVLPPRDRSLSSRWATDEFRDELRAWCEELIGPVTAMEQHKLRGWATVWRVSTVDGSWFAKQNCPGQLFEQPLLALLARLVPDRVVPVAGEGDGFLLTPDQGPVFRETAGDHLENWVRLARDAALLQRELLPHQRGLLAAGTTELKPEETPDYVAARVEQYAGLGADDPRRLDPDVAARLRAHLPVVRRWAEEVAALRLPVTLNHNDLHENNVFDVDGRLRFFDFGDAVWAHPFTTLSVPVGVLCREWDTQPDDPRIARVVDCYLDAWTDVAALAELREAARLARMLGSVHRFESWRRLLDGSPLDEHREEAENLHYWLGRIAEMSSD